MASWISFPTEEQACFPSDKRKNKVFLVLGFFFSGEYNLMESMAGSEIKFFSCVPRLHFCFISICLGDGALTMATNTPLVPTRPGSCFCVFVWDSVLIGYFWAPLANFWAFFFFSHKPLKLCSENYFTFNLFGQKNTVQFL